MNVAAPKPRLAQPGRNCWRTARADHFGVVVDGADYFRALKHALLAAKRSILIIGWEFDSRTTLVRGELTSKPNEIGPLLDHLVRTRPGLRAHVLIWDSAMIYAFNREFAGMVKMDWLTHRRLRFKLDDSHPIASSQHQKIVVVDEVLAFVGGFDITSQRWDSRDHVPLDPHRNDPAFTDYPPFHDIMAVVTGEAARALAEIGRDRWRRASGEVLKVPRPGDAEALWPPFLPVLMRRVEVAIARTSPAWDGVPPVREVEQLYVDMIAAARRFIYMENQYFASRRIAELLADRLSSPDCPEIVLINPGEPVSLVERSTMGVTRARLARRLAQADGGGRLRIYYPSVDGDDVKVHSKLMIVDDVLLRIGSSNLNNRSLGLDTECDVLVEAESDPAITGAIRALRHDLLAEHLGTTADEVARAEAEQGGMLGAIQSLQGRRHTLVPLDDREPSGIVHILDDSGLPDPEEPVETLVWLDRAMPGPARRGLAVRVWGLTLLLATLTLGAALWRWAPFSVWAVVWPWVQGLLSLRGQSGITLAVMGGFLLAGLLRAPVSLAVLATAALLGPWLGFVHSLLGVMSSAALLYGLGHALGRARVRRLAGWKVNRVHRALTRHGMLAILLLRLMPVAGFSVINLVAGASAVGFRDFVLGTIIGVAPGILAMSVLGDRLLAVLRTPSVENISVLVFATALVITAQFLVVGRLGRARAPSPGR
ncbi:MAG: VTT domain-containing protein [Rhodospirillaceae bacterium]|nr:VTT domain-containing protein [Rhodospirillales bacterium]